MDAGLRGMDVCSPGPDGEIFEIFQSMYVGVLVCACVCMCVCVCVYVCVCVPI